MPAYSSPLTDTLPPEVRIRIYREVLRANWPLAIARRESAGAFRFQTSLLSVCKSVYYEASDVFFEVNTIHLRRYSELQRLFKVDRRFRNDLRVLQNHELFPEYVDVGVAALQRSQGPTIRFVDKWLTKAWAQVKERGHINVVEEYIRASTLKICRGPEEFYDSCAGPAIWCALYDYCTQVGDNEVCQAMRGLRQEMQRRLAKIPISSSHAKLPQDLSLRDVSPELVGSDVMEWLSELLLHARLDSHALARLRDYLWSKR
ncbi:hypothetical protein KC367_g5319 [Hortaea werneckii]|uniref:Uncharacterized protein n=1 Tax=Hortaea werneckii EXF-2000 TaxID=1157616 RepID=A0A1Z5SR21_HORWE|nr:hypothetical protein KC350_g16354 [Hortaea werneckii]OTA23274.1 hypothetical protein BTJ68_13103 [Hortaea werneckii EXF-2000]KAI6846397.1 hypothetical protein KC358_g2848 [Hortaea werneckii]KAI6931532.1 hypothetical protein KC348_g7231 [Hortaea werneckii]KAI6935902.1 hypothetical protein KC341_g6604 [Hortaea werneckii]